jgi:hypothetical protein
LKKFRLKRTWPVAAVGLVGLVGLAYAATQVIEFTINTPVAVSEGGNGDKPKIQRAGNGLLVTAYGDSPEGAGLVYDVKGGVERTARDIYVRTCNHLTANCDDPANWSGPVNISNSALQTSISTDWKGLTDGDAGTLPYPGDIDKANIKTSGPVMVLTWVSNYCPDGDLATPGVQAPVQRAVRYLERDSRVIPFACTWMAYSKNQGAAWSAPIQLSTGERDAKQDSSFGSVSTDPASPSYQKGQVAISWQEDPRGLQLGEADGPGDGASGANVSNGTDVWYTWATVDLSVPNTAADDFVLAAPSGEPLAQGYRVTDNQTSVGIGGTDEANPVFDGTGMQVDKGTIESGQTGAARPNIGMVGSNTIIAYEETKGSLGLDEGKFIRYHTFTFNKPTPIIGDANSNNLAGCIISDPLKNGRRVRFLTQSPADAGTGGINIAIFWKEGAYDKGGPSDIRVRRGMGGLKPTNMVPAVAVDCATSDYTTAIGLASQPGENISSRASVVTDADNGLADGTEVNYTENALAHRGVLRGNDLWIGYSYTADLVKLWAQLDNYNFWVRKFTFDPVAASGSWGLPTNLTNVTDTGINVREPRFFGTQGSSRTACPSGDPTAADTTDATLCQARDVIFVAWGTQTNVSPYDPVGGEDLGIYITVSNDAGVTYATPVQYSVAQGPLFQDDESAFEAQIVTRPDGQQFYGMWNQANAATGETFAEYSSGSWALVDVPEPPLPPVDDGGDGGSGGCSMSDGRAPFDPTLWLLAGMGLAGLGLRRLGRR